MRRAVIICLALLTIVPRGQLSRRLYAKPVSCRSNSHRTERIGADGRSRGPRLSQAIRRRSRLPYDRKPDRYGHARSAHARRSRKAPG